MAAPVLKPIEPSESKRPLVSIVMTTYRRPHHIAQTIGSLLEQTCGDFELLIRDDSRDDETERVVRAIPDDRIQYHRNPERLNMPGNLNSGIAASRGRYVVVCHDHDLYHRTRLEKLLALFDEHDDLAYAHSGNRMIREDGSPTGTVHVGDFARHTPGRDWLRILLSSFASRVSADAMVPRAFYERYGLYDPEYGFISDVEMWMRLCRAGAVGYVAEPLSEYREREEGHEYLGVNWGVIETIARIHSRYHREAFTGLTRRWRETLLPLRFDRFVAYQYLICIKHRDAAGRSAGRGYIRREGRLLSRALALVC